MLHRIVHRLIMKGVAYFTREATKSALPFIFGYPAHKVALTAERAKEALKSEDQRQLEAEEKRRFTEEYERSLAIPRQCNKVAVRFRVACWVCWLCWIFGFWNSFALMFTDIWWVWLFLPVMGLVIRFVGLKLGYKHDEYL